LPLTKNLHLIGPGAGSLALERQSGGEGGAFRTLAVIEKKSLRLRPVQAAKCISNLVETGESLWLTWLIP
jgi:hypothetical protein